MADATQALQNIVDYDERTVRRIPVAAAETIYRGTIVCYDAGGDATPADDSGPVAGIALETVKNTASGAADGDVFVKVARRARAIFNGTATLAAAAQTGINTVCYPSDSQTVTHTAGTNIVGRVYAAEDFTARHGMTNAVMVDFDLGS